MATARMTVGTVFETVSNAAVAVSTVLGTGIKAVNMLDTYVSDASKKQNLRSIIEMEQFEVKLVEEVAMEDTQRHLKIQEFCSQSTEQGNLYKSNFDRLQKLLESKRK